MKKLEKIKKTVKLDSNSGKVKNSGLIDANLFSPTKISAQVKRIVYKGRVIEIKYNITLLSKYKRY